MRTHSTTCYLKPMRSVGIPQRYTVFAINRKLRIIQLFSNSRTFLATIYLQLATAATASMFLFNLVGLGPIVAISTHTFSSTDAFSALWHLLGPRMFVYCSYLHLIPGKIDETRAQPDSIICYLSIVLRFLRVPV
ncbi:hypothetical protein C8R43DRAFT_1044352 [Mycena crocata]|nr:hypothetical protein C8R43DRAFT_1044352 [Mycena crocata]